MKGIVFGREEVLQDYQMNAVHPSIRMRAVGLLMLHVGVYGGGKIGADIATLGLKGMQRGWRRCTPVTSGTATLLN